MQLLKKVNRRSVFYGIGLGLITLLIRTVLSYFPTLTETIYSRAFFQGIRYILDYSIGWCPFPFSYLLIAILLCYWFYRIFSFVKMVPSQRSWVQVILSIFSGVGYVIFFFMFMWGFNYARVPMDQQLGITSSDMTLASLRTELEISTKELIAVRERLSIVGREVSWNDLPTNLEDELRTLVESKMKELGYPIPGKVRGRLLNPKGVLLRISTAGVYNPFTGESNVDNGLHPLQIPFTMTHEFTHGYGITSEAACNFVAYLACKESKNPIIKYAGHLGYWRYVAGNFKAAEREKYKVFRSKLPETITGDLQAIYSNSDKYPDILPDLRDLIYGSFLKAQGISDGLQNYSKVVKMNVAWRQKKEGQKK